MAKAYLTFEEQRKEKEESHCEESEDGKHKMVKHQVKNRWRIQQGSKCSKCGMSYLYPY